MKIDRAGKHHATNPDIKDYKGIYADSVKEKKYFCPVTGAHFEFKDMYRRIQQLLQLSPTLEEKDFTVSTVKDHNFKTEQTLPDKPLTSRAKLN